MIIKVRIPRWLLLPVWWLFVVPVLLTGDLLRAAWQFMAGDDEHPSRWEWASVALVGLIVLGTLGSMQGWWA